MDNMPWQQGKQYVCISKYDLAIKERHSEVVDRLFSISQNK